MATRTEQLDAVLDTWTAIDAEYGERLVKAFDDQAEAELVNVVGFLSQGAACSWEECRYYGMMQPLEDGHLCRSCTGALFLQGGQRAPRLEDLPELVRERLAGVTPRDPV